MISLSQSMLGLFATLLIFFFAAVKCSKRERINNCTQENQCKINASACLDTMEIGECMGLHTTKIYNEPGLRPISVNSTNLSIYPSQKFSIFETYYNESYHITRIIKACCDMSFGKTCMIPPKRKNYFVSVYSVTKEKRICHQAVEYHERVGETVWCCELNESCKVFPCLKFENGQMVKHDSIEPISFDRHDIAEYCFFTASQKQLEGKQLTENLIYDVDGFTLDIVNMSVNVNETRQNCNNKTIVNLSLDKVDLPCVPRGKSWCFFVRGDGFQKFSSFATCFVKNDECSNTEKVEVELIVVLATVAILTTLLVIAIALVCLYKSKIKSAFQKKEDTIKEIPQCTKEMVMGIDSDTRMAQKEKSGSYILYKEGKSETFERYINTNKVITMEYQINEKPEKITYIIKKAETDIDIQKPTKKFRERFDSGLPDLSGDDGRNLANDLIPNESGYTSKIQFDSGFSSTTQLSGITTVDSGMSSMASDSGGNFSLADEDHVTKHSRSPDALRDLAKKATLLPDKRIALLPILNENSCHFDNSIKSKDSQNNDIILPEFVCNAPSGYMDKNVFMEIHGTNLESHDMFRKSLKNIDSLQDSTSPSFCSNKFEKSEERISDERKDELRGNKIPEKQQRISESSMDTGCETSSNDEDNYSRKISLNEEIASPDTDNCQGYMMKSDPLLYERQNVLHPTFCAFPKQISEFSGYTAKCDV